MALGTGIDIGGLVVSEEYVKRYLGVSGAEALRSWQGLGKDLYKWVDITGTDLPDPNQVAQAGKPNLTFGQGVMMLLMIRAVSRAMEAGHKDPVAIGAYAAGVISSLDIAGLLTDAVKEQATPDAGDNKGA